MVQSQNIDVYVAPHNDLTERYPQYGVFANSPAYTGDPNEVYIEAADGQRFVIVVDLLKDFDFKGATALQVGFAIDEGPDGSQSVDSGTREHLRQSAPEASGLQGRLIHSETSREFKGDWYHSGYMFSALKMDEDLELSSEEIEADKETFGKIEVNVQRGNIKTTANSTNHVVARSYGKSITCQMLKLRRRNSPRTIAFHTASTPPSKFNSKKEWQALRGNAGNTITFTIRYRSYDALQRLKIAPKHKSYIDLTISPPASPSVKEECKGETTEIESLKIKREEADNDVQQGFEAVATTQIPTTQVLAAHSRHPLQLPDTNTAGTSKLVNEERAKKRKAMQDELRELEIEQKRLRLMRELAELESEG